MKVFQISFNLRLFLTLFLVQFPPCLRVAPVTFILDFVVVWWISVSSRYQNLKPYLMLQSMRELKKNLKKTTFIGLFPPVIWRVKISKCFKWSWIPYSMGKLIPESTYYSISLFNIFTKICAVQKKKKKTLRNNIVNYIVVTIAFPQR